MGRGLHHRRKGLDREILKSPGHGGWRNHGSRKQKVTMILIDFLFSPCSVNGYTCKWDGIQLNVTRNLIDWIIVWHILSHNVTLRVNFMLYVCICISSLPLADAHHQGQALSEIEWALSMPISILVQPNSKINPHKCPTQLSDDSVNKINKNQIENLHIFLDFHPKYMKTFFFFNL